MGKIPEKIRTYSDIIWDDSEKNKVRVCEECFKYIGDINRIRYIIRIFEEAQLNIMELMIIGHVTKDYEDAACLLLTNFREIQYKMSIEELTQKEKKILWINRNFLGGHSRWMVQLIKSIDHYIPLELTDNLEEETKTKVSQHEVVEEIIMSKKKNSCLNIMCSRFCSEEIEMNDALDLIRFNHNYPLVSNIIIHTLAELKHHKIIHYIPFFVINLNTNKYLFDHLLKRGLQCIELMTSLYWAIHVYVDNIGDRKLFIMNLINYIKTNTQTENTLEYRTRFKIMMKLGNINNDVLDLLEENKKIVVPVLPNINMIGIDRKNIKVMNSYSKPILIPFISEDQRIHKVLFKKEDIRKDHLIMCIINLINCIVLEEENVELPAITYRIQPTSTTGGYIQIVDGAQTIFNIVENSGFTIQNYIMENNKDMSIQNFRDRFIISTALYCVISYLLGIGDRHLDNIMVSKDGLLFHIDFSFILGQDPKYSNNKTIRVTPEIVNVIGGYGSEDYQKFKKYCSTIYNRLRMHVNLFSNLLSMIPLIDPTINMERIRQELISRFEIGENRVDAEVHMSNKVDRDGNSFEYVLIDFLYKSKNSSVVKGIGYLKDKLFGLVSNDK